MEEDIHFKKVFLITLIVSLSISALLGIIIFLAGSFGEISVKILFTTLTVGGFSLTGLCCATLFDKKRFTIFAILGIIISFLGFLTVTFLIWEMIPLGFFDFWKTALIITITSFSFAQASLLLLIKSDKTIVNVSLSTTLLFISLVALELIFLILIEFNDVDELWFRILGVFAILDVLGTIITPIILKVTSLHDRDESLR